VAAQLPDVKTPQVGDPGLRVGSSGSGQEGQDFDGLVISVLESPRLFAVNVVVRRLGETDATWLQLDRSRLRISAASTSRPASTSPCD
jgi:hypothetical protein